MPTDIWDTFGGARLEFDGVTLRNTATIPALSPLAGKVPGIAPMLNGPVGLDYLGYASSAGLLLRNLTVHDTQRRAWLQLNPHWDTDSIVGNVRVIQPSCFANSSKPLPNLKVQCQPPKKMKSDDAPPIVLHVAADGSDGGHSGISLAAVPEALRSLRKQERGRAAPVHVHLAAGVHRLAAPLVLTEEHSDHQGGVRFIGAEGAVVSGGLAVSGWRAVAGEAELLEAPLPAALREPPRQLYVKGQRAQRTVSPTILVGEILSVGKNQAFPADRRGKRKCRRPGRSEHHS